MSRKTLFSKEQKASALNRKGLLILDNQVHEVE
jgi:hypothetical protein